ncbi:hypothetical protein FACS189429_6680 [Bacteroidia bacterium]|nr:hypothetical protein FACS189429_6680 [Bacteroidia bacterium]
MLIAVDFDGTIVTHEYPRIGKEIPFAIATLKQLANNGHRLILWSVREGKELNEAVEFCRSKGLEFYAVNSNYPEELPAGEMQPRKLMVDLFIDDRNLGGLPDWGIIYRMIASGDPFNPASANNIEDMQPAKKKKWGIF